MAAITEPVVITAPVAPMIITISPGAGAPLVVPSADPMTSQALPVSAPFLSAGA